MDSSRVTPKQEKQAGGHCIQDSSLRKELYSGMSYTSCDLLPDIAAMPTCQITHCTTWA